MKTKSKLVLGLSILSAATLAAGTTSTFAWYVVTNSGTATAEAQNITASTAKAAPESVSTLSFTLSPTITAIKSSNGDYNNDSTDEDYNPMTGAMELTRFLDSAPSPLEDSEDTEDKFYFAYYLTGNTENEHWHTNQFGTADFWRVYKIEYAIPESDTDADTGVTYTQAQIYAAISAKKFVIKANAKTADSSSAHLWASTSAGALPSAENVIKSGNDQVTLAENIGFSAADGKLTAYVGVYVDAGDVVNTVGSEPNGNFQITIGEYTAPVTP